MKKCEKKIDLNLISIQVSEMLGTGRVKMILIRVYDYISNDYFYVAVLYCENSLSHIHIYAHIKLPPELFLYVI